MSLYELVKAPLLRLMKAPTEPPEAPAGTHASTRVFRASPRFLSYRLLAFWISVLVFVPLPPILALVGLSTGEAPPFWIAVTSLPVLLLAFFLAYFSVRIDYDLRYYIVTDRSLRVREGAFVVREKTLSFANVQNMRLVQGPLMRAFGIWHLEIDTAGGGSAEAKQKGESAHTARIAGVENAAEVRETIRAHLRTRGRDAGLGDLDDESRAWRDPRLVAALRETAEAAAALRRAVSAPGPDPGPEL